jgi:large subunit ribosomal protein L4
MIEAPHFSPAGGRKTGGFSLPADYFDGDVNDAAMHQAVKVYLNNQRQGTAKTKSRSFVSGGNQKPWRQKGTGRARQGSIRAPHWRGGGIVFGPTPRDYRTGIPRKLKQLARRSALNARAAAKHLFVVEQFQFSEPKTGQMAELIEKLGLTGQNVLVLTHGPNQLVYLSGRNIPNVRVMPYTDAAAYDVLWCAAVVTEEGAFSGAPPVPYVGPAAIVRPERAKARPAAEAKPAKKAAEKPAKKAAKPKAEKSAKKKPAAKKPAAKKPGPKKKGGK